MDVKWFDLTEAIDHCSLEKKIDEISTYIERKTSN